VAIGKRIDRTVAHLVHKVVRLLVATADRLTFAFDDTPAPRSGPKAQRGGPHHNPTWGRVPGPQASGRREPQDRWLAARFGGVGTRVHGYGRSPYRVPVGHGPSAIEPGG
jgi:hypothetical protein